MNILALDDEKDVKVLYEYFFASEVDQGKIKLKVFHNPHELLDFVSPSDEETLLLTDMRMPSMSGVEVAEELVKRLPNLRVFVISALGVNLTEEEKKKLRIERVYTKPLNFTQLKDDVVELI